MVTLKFQIGLGVPLWKYDPCDLCRERAFVHLFKARYPKFRRFIVLDIYHLKINYF
jgi:hypothetical protein